MMLLSNFNYAFVPKKLCRHALRSSFSSGHQINEKKRHRKLSLSGSTGTATTSVSTTNDSFKPSTTTDTEKDDNKFVKRKVAMVFSYVGSKYNGLQFDTTFNFKTVESEIQKALFEVGCINPSNLNDLPKIGWSRSSRVSD